MQMIWKDIEESYNENIKENLTFQKNKNSKNFQVIFSFKN